MTAALNPLSDPVGVLSSKPIVYLIGLVIVGVLLFWLASVVFGRGEELAPMPVDSAPLQFPSDQAATGDDVRGVRLPVVLRGYRMSDVDEVLDKLAIQIDEHDTEIRQLREELEAKSVTHDSLVMDNAVLPMVIDDASSRSEAGDEHDDEVLPAAQGDRGRDSDE